MADNVAKHCQVPVGGNRGGVGVRGMLRTSLACTKMHGCHNTIHQKAQITESLPARGFVLKAVLAQRESHFNRFPQKILAYTSKESTGEASMLFVS